MTKDVDTGAHAPSPPLTTDTPASLQDLLLAVRELLATNNGASEACAIERLREAARAPLSDGGALLDSTLEAIESIRAAGPNAGTGIFVRARVGDGWDAVDIADLPREALSTWLDGLDADELRRTILIIFHGAGAFVPFVQTRPTDVEPAPRQVPRSQACQLGYHHQCPGENTLGTSRCLCDCHGGGQ